MEYENTKGEVCTCKCEGGFNFIFIACEIMKDKAMSIIKYCKKESIHDDRKNPLNGGSITGT